MTDIIYSIIIPVIFFVMPICFIVYGLINKRNSFAGYLLMVGCFFLSLPLSVYITPAVSGLICYFLSIIGISASFSDTTILSMILIVFLVYIAYKLYYIFLYWESRNYTQTVKELVFLGQKNLFRATQTDEKLRRENIRGKQAAHNTHYEVGRKVRQTIKELGGTMPEDLPTPEKSIAQIEREQKKLKNGNNE